MQANRDQSKALRAARYEGKAIESKKALVKECIKERERETGEMAKKGKEQERERRD